MRGSTIDRGFKHHFIARITQLRSPQKMRLNRFHHLAQRVEYIINVLLRELMHLHDLWTLQNGFIFQP